MKTISKATINRFGVREIVGEHATLTLRATNFVANKMNVPYNQMDKKTAIALGEIEEILIRSGVDIGVILSRII